ncbi:MAG: NADH-quinone oxidoreductase subunit C, partial [Opitutaceae bacterium]
METPEQIRERILARFPGAEVNVVTNPGPAAQHSLLIGAAHAAAIAAFLRDDPVLRLDTCSNVTGVDWPEREIVETVRKPTPPEPGADPAAPPKILEEKIKRLVPGHLEVVYHLYSVSLKHGPVILRLRTADRGANVTLPSLTPVWRACEFQ